MPTRPFSELYDLVLPYVPAVETPLVDYHIRRVTREFCRRTTLWRRRVTITTQPGVNDYLLAPYDAANGTPGGGAGGGTGGSGGSGGGDPAWVPAGQQAFISNSGGGGDEVIAYDPNTSILTVVSSPEYSDSSNAVYASVRIGQMGVGYLTRLTFLPIYFQGGISEWSEFSYVSGTYLPVTVQSFFTAFSGSGGTQIEFFNQSFDSGDGVIREWTPTPLVFTNGGESPEPVPIDEFQFQQGYASETSSTVAFNALVEIFTGGTDPEPEPEPDPDICDPYSIISVVCDGRPLPALPEDRRDPYGARPADGQPRAWYSPSARVVHLYPTPAAVHNVVVDVVCALTMTPTVPAMPEFLFVDYREIIADGVIASLKALGNKPWYDPEGASQYARRYANAVQGIRGKLRDGNQPNVSTARGPRFGR